MKGSSNQDSKIGKNEKKSEGIGILIKNYVYLLWTVVL